MESHKNPTNESPEGGVNKMTIPIIQVQGVNKEYGRGKKTVAALKDINL